MEKLTLFQYFKRNHYDIVILFLTAMNVVSFKEVMEIGGWAWSFTVILTLAKVLTLVLGYCAYRKYERTLH